jgi:hypothetical protein
MPHRAPRITSRMAQQEIRLMHIALRIVFSLIGLSTSVPGGSPTDPPGLFTSSRDPR